MKFYKLLAFFYTVAMAACSGHSANNRSVLSPVDFKEKFEGDDNAYLVDARTPEEYAEGHLAGAHLMDWLDTANFKKEAAALDKSKTIYIYCRSGRRSAAAAKYLSDQGFSVVDMDGGIQAWNAQKLPTVND